MLDAHVHLISFRCLKTDFRIHIFKLRQYSELGTSLFNIKYEELAISYLSKT